MALIISAKYMLALHEGWRNKPYKDTTGHLTIGAGRNLSDKGVSDDEVHVLLENDIGDALVDCYKLFGDQFDDFTEGRQLALLDMAFNLGRTNLSQFKRMRAAIREHNWSLAAAEALDSKWATQVGQRAQRVARMIETGDHEFYGGRTKERMGNLGTAYTDLSIPLEAGNTMVFSEIKGALRSVTVLSSLLGVVGPSLLKIIEHWQSIDPLLISDTQAFVITTISGALALWGRWRATKLLRGFL